MDLGCRLSKAKVLDRVRRVTRSWARRSRGVGLRQRQPSFAKWMDQAGILEVNQRADLGHGPQRIPDLYGWHDVVRFLDGDAENLVGFLVGSLGEELTQVLMSRPGIEPGACGLKVRLSNRPFTEDSGKTSTSRPSDRNKAD